MTREKHTGVICENRRARFNYALEEFFEGGLVLEGSEVKSLRLGHAQLNEAYASFSRGELWLVGAHIPLYSHAAESTGHTDERRSRKILMHAKELKKLQNAVQAQGYTLVPLRLKWKHRVVKVDLALAKGKNVVDKRETIKRREQERDLLRLKKGGARKG
jgi:SsrA-binding protein